MHTIGTHDGVFHTDEAMAVATVLFVHPNATIVRTRDPKVLATCEILIDVGGEYDPSRGRFDHHQKGGAGEYEDGIKLSSFGLVWKEYGEQVCGDAVVAEEIRRRLVAPVDARDNGQKPVAPPNSIPTIADMIADMNASWCEDLVEDATFLQAVGAATFVLKRMIVHAVSERRAAQLVRKALEARNEDVPHGILVLDQDMPWHKVVVEEAPSVRFVVMPNRAKSEWCAWGVPVALGAQSVRKTFPKEWGGLRDEALADVTGVGDAKFSHNNGFVAIARSKEGAVTLATRAIDW
ncbi:MYG1 family protein [Candidatus Uhrbacteria bacterium]|nr:MYG1 family protein [Candidatus Uhrbacteria bacterium]